MVEAWEKHFEAKYSFNGAADAQAIKKLIGTFTDEEIMSRFDMFLNDRDYFVTKQGHTIAFFTKQVNSYRPQPKQKGFTLEDIAKQ